MGPKTRSLISMLEELSALLGRNGEVHWASWMEENIRQIRAGDLHGVERLLSGYGGMGSLNELALHPASGHGVEEASVRAVNARLSELLSGAFSLGKELWREAQDR